MSEANATLPEITTAETAPAESAPTESTPEKAPDPRHALARLVLEDFVVTQLLRQGRPLKNSDLTAAAEGFTLSRATLRDGLAGSRRVVSRGRDWDLAVRVEAAARPRHERTRKPLEGSVEELLQAVGKPLPLPVIVREVAAMRGVLPEVVRDATATLIKTARRIVTVAPQYYLHQDFTLDAGAPTEELVIRENKLEADANFLALRNAKLPQNSGGLSERATAILQAAKRPLSQKALGFLLWQQNPESFDARELAAAVGDRSAFYSFVGGIVTTQAQLPGWKGALQNYTLELGSAAADALDVATLLRQRVAPEAVITPRAEEIEEIKSTARASGQPLSVVSVLTDTLEMEIDDPAFIPTLQGLNEALRKSGEWLPTGIGRFLLRESVPAAVGTIPESLRPVHLAIHNAETDESYDVEMSDDGLEGDAADFIHAPQWEDVSEEFEVKLPRRNAAEPIADVHYIVLYHHWKAGTLKLRRQDEEFFALQGPLSRLAVRAHDAEGAENLAMWASRESGLILGLEEWLAPRVPASGGSLQFTRENGELQLHLGAPDKQTFLDADRIAELEALQERSAYLSLFDLLQSVMSAHPNGAELPTIWAEVNTLRRTTKRLMCSVLCAYHCFYFRQRGPQQIFWRFEEARLDQGFKRNKRKFVRR